MPASTEWRRSPGVYALFIVAVLAGLFVPYWVTGQVFGTFDLAHITIPLEQLFARYQARGDLPAWVSEFNAGFPLMANGFQSFWYLPHVILRPLLPAVWLVNISLFAHLLLAAAGIWLTLRSRHLRPAAAAVGVLLFCAGGYFAGRISLPHLFFPAAWAPLVLWAAVRLWEQPTGPRAAALAASFSGLVFAGHIQMAVYAGVMLAVSFGIAVLHRLAAPRSLPRLAAGGIAAGLLVIPLIAVHVLPVWEHVPLSRRGEVQSETEAYDVSYPAWHALSLIHPGAFGLRESYAGPKNEPELMAYVGAAGLLLGLIGTVTSRLLREPLGQTALALLIGGALLAGGGYSPFYRWLHELPTAFAGFANPGRAIFLVFWAWSIAAAYGAEYLIGRPPARHTARLAAALALMALLVLSAYAALPSNAVHEALLGTVWRIAPVVALAAVVLLALPVLPGIALRRWVLLGVVTIELSLLWHTVAQPVSSQALTSPLLLRDHLPAREDAPRIYSQRSIEPVSFGDFGITPGFVLTGAAPVEQTLQAQADNVQSFAVDLTWHQRSPRPGRVLLDVLDDQNRVIRHAEVDGGSIRPEEPTVFTFDPITGSNGQRYTVRLTSSYARQHAPSVYIRANPAGSDFNPTGQAATCPGQRCQPVYNTDWNTAVDLSLVPAYAAPPRYLARELLIPMFGEGEGYQMVRAHLTLQWKRYDDYMHLLGERGDFKAEYLVTNRGMLDRLAVGTILSSYPSYRALPGMPDITLLAARDLGERMVHAYQNEAAFPRVHLAATVRTAAPAQAHELIHAAKLAADEVVVENLALPSGIGDDAAAQAELLADTGERVTVRVTTRSPQLLVLRDVNLPGWSATIDDTPAAINTVDTLFRGVVVPAGTHTVVFNYFSPALYWGARLSGIAWVSLILIAAGQWCTRGRFMRFWRAMP